MKKTILFLISSISILSTYLYFSNDHGKQLLKSNFLESQYASAEEIFINNTDHLDKLANFVQKKVVPNLSNKNSFLDIGAGPGHITQRISKYFVSTSVVEPNKYYDSLYKNLGYRNFGANFQELNIQDRYDFVLCSHVLYHLPQNQWTSFIKKMFSVTNEKGKGIIILVAPKGIWHDLRVAINPHYSNSGVAEASLKSLDIPFQTTLIKSSFKTENHEKFKDLVKLFTIDDCFIEGEFQQLPVFQQQNIYKLIDTFVDSCRNEEGVYELVCEDNYIEFSK